MVKTSNYNLRISVFDEISYVSPTWDQMGEYTFKLATKILDSGHDFDRVVALAKGGWTWARTLCDYISIDEVSSLRIKSYTGVNEPTAPKITQPLAEPINGENILLFDEVIDSGETIKKAAEYLKMMGAKSVFTASLCYKPRSCVKPDFYAFTTDAWVVHPHEIRETIEQLSNTWKISGLKNEDIIKRLDKIGLPDTQVKYFLEKMNS